MSREDPSFDTLDEYTDHGDRVDRREDMPGPPETLYIAAGGFFLYERKHYRVRPGDRHQICYSHEYEFDRGTMLLTSQQDGHQLRAALA